MLCSSAPCVNSVHERVSLMDVIPPHRSLQETNTELGDDLADLKKKMSEFEQKVYIHLSSPTSPLSPFITSPLPSCIYMYIHTCTCTCTCATWYMYMYMCDMVHVHVCIIYTVHRVQNGLLHS